MSFLVALSVTIESAFKIAEGDHKARPAVDEAEFEIGVTGPEGTNLAVMNETMAAIEKDLLNTHGVETVMSSAGGGR